MDTNIHETAIISKGAEIGQGTIIGPYCVIGENVQIGDGCKLQSHIVVDGHTKVGANNQFFPYCTIGTAPQDISYNDEPTRVEIGDNNTFREYISLNRGTTKQDNITIIGSENLFMAYTHFGHDVVIGNKVRVVNSCNFAGHVKIGDGAIISGGSNVSQYITIGRGAFIGGGSALDRDVPCFCTAYGNRIKLKGVNIIGLKRMGFEKVKISELVEFYRMMEASALSPRSFVENNELMDQFTDNELIQEVATFISDSKVGIPPFMS
jgi:UDP-N-acetylglucosamine acyltransferase